MCLVVDVLVVFTNAAAYSSSAAVASSSSSSGLQPVKVVAPYGVSGVKSGNACPWLLYSCLSVIQEKIPHRTILGQGE